MEIKFFFKKIILSVLDNHDDLLNSFPTSEIRNSIRNPIRHPILDSIRNPIRNPIRDPVRDPVRDNPAERAKRA